MARPSICTKELMDCICKRIVKIEVTPELNLKNNQINQNKEWSV
ncbi:hypothetical protein [Commensalibacter papalotli (ex Botero et al. 2024)]|uniref:Transposase n=1 Tax=Commensalibacter papalotli (ex Botero et al. 2024) TaxID=2972766 RepID=A0ABM9HLY3_9PROT|nr:hypothetical protein [Commensalibacter papalotli (ex Botero et al. 2024)]CAI3933596.1 unnamed protein product [Commensalibacter papalotli (ex Botero et al. 2024)]CAI3949628.1 unnamed protein product [Commensalibacter papalotli (ex Botero et al. 2024)]